MLNRAIKWGGWLGMALLLLALPFTSFPLVSRLMGGTMVAPLAALPLLLVSAAFLLPFFLKGGRLPPQTYPLLAFLAVVILSCAAAFFLPFPPFRRAVVWSSEIKALAALAVGVGFYLAAMLYPRQPEQLAWMLRLINWSGLLVIVWSVAQFLVWWRTGNYPDWMWALQENLSASKLLYFQRANGFAYEPSWLANQMNMLYLPYWLAAAVSGYTAHSRKLWKIHFEHLLLLGGTVTLLLSVSRVGWLAFLLAVAYLMLRLNLALVGWLRGKIFHPDRGIRPRARLAWKAFPILSYLILFAIYAGLFFGMGLILSRVDQRMARVFDLTPLFRDGPLYYANQLVFAERMVFWQAGWAIFNDHPILGVGLGNAGYFFAEKLNAFSWSLTEVRTLMYQWGSLPNIKSLWVRILAEAGMLGFAFFASWLFVTWESAHFLRHQPRRMYNALGLMGAFVLVALLAEGFSLDTFALPYFWVAFGLLTAGCEMARCLRE